MQMLAAAFWSLALAGLVAVVTDLSKPQAPATVAEQPPIAVFPDFVSIKSIEVKKQQFFDYLQDYVIAENQAVAASRAELSTLAAIANSGVAFSIREREWLLDLAANYRVESAKLSDRELVNELLLRVDGLPVSLVLAQAANESAWGTSRFALEGNNVFGQWCYQEGCGIVPKRRRVGAVHEVKTFESIAGSVEAYFRNINTHASYQYLRRMRAEMRSREQKLDPMVLALGLGHYSERGEHYVDELQNIILQNRLRRRDHG